MRGKPQCCTPLQDSITIQELTGQVWPGLAWVALLCFRSLTGLDFKIVFHHRCRRQTRIQTLEDEVDDKESVELDLCGSDSTESGQHSSTDQLGKRSMQINA